MIYKLLDISGFFVFSLIGILPGLPAFSACNSCCIPIAAKASLPCKLITGKLTYD